MRYIPFAICSLLLVSSAQAASFQYYVSDAGSDTWSGTLSEPNQTQTDGPFKTLCRAATAASLHELPDSVMVDIVGTTAVAENASCSFAGNSWITSDATPLSLGASADITIAGPLAASPSSQAFLYEPGGAVHLTENASREVWGAWWGHSTSATWQGNDLALQRAVASLGSGGTLHLGQGTYLHGLIEVGDGMTLAGYSTAAKTIVKLPDNHPIDLRLYPGTLTGITALSGIGSCTIRDIEYDGNAPQNRSWGSGFEDWGSTEYLQTYTMGVYVGPYPTDRVVPSGTVTLRDLYIHDTVRDGIVVGGGAYVDAANITIRNSDTDHLLYGSQLEPSTFSNIILEGYWRETAVVTYGQSFYGITIRNVTANPTVYDIGHLISCRSHLGRTGTKDHAPYLDGVSLESIPLIPDSQHPTDKLTYGIFVLEDMDLSSLSFSQSGGSTSPFHLLMSSTSSAMSGASGYLSASDISVSGVRAAGFHLYTASSGPGDDPHENVTIDGAEIYYAETGGPTTTAALITLYDHANTGAFSSINTYGASPRLVVTTSGITATDFTFTGMTIDPTASAISHIAFLNSGSDFTVWDSSFPAGSTVSSAFRPSKIRFCGPSYVGTTAWEDCE